MSAGSGRAAAIRRIGGEYAAGIEAVLGSVLDAGSESMLEAAEAIADRVADDRLVHVYGPGAHSNLATQDVFYRPGCLMNISPILDERTLLSSGALASTAVERTPGYGAEVIAAAGLDPGGVLVLVNAFGINSAVIDAARTARRGGVTTVGISSRAAAAETPVGHPARHPEGLDLHDVVDIHIDSHMPGGDVVIAPAGGTEATEGTGGVSTITNAFCLHWLMMATITVLAERGIEAPIWRSRNAPGGDEANARGIAAFQGRVKHL